MIYTSKIAINSNISIHIPKLADIFTIGEDHYHQLTALFTSTPKDYMVQLDDMGIDFEALTDFDLFSQLLIKVIQQKDTTIYFGSFSFANFALSFNHESGEKILYDKINDIIIDRYIYQQISDTIRQINHTIYDRKKPGNKEAKQFMIERARKQLKRNQHKKKQTSQLEAAIAAIVNCPEFNYNYQTVLELNIYTFYQSIYSVQKRIHYDQIMAGIYAGTISAKDIHLKEINWLN